MSASALSLATAPNSPSAVQGICRLDRNSFGHCMGLLTTEDLLISCSVSKSWRLFIDSANGQFLWRNASIREGVPVVEGNGRNYKDEFKFLRPITIGGMTIARYLGEIVGEVPCMREDRFLELRDSSDFFKPKKFKRDTYCVLVDPAALKIKTGQNRPLVLGESGTLVEVPEADREGIDSKDLIVPFSFKNLKALAKYPLAGVENSPVFDPNSIDEVFDQCDTSSNGNRVFIIRKKAVLEDMLFPGDHSQNAQKVSTLRQRGFYDAIWILKTGTCPDSQDPFICVRTAERVRIGATDYPAAIGGFAPGNGVNVYTSTGVIYGFRGVVPVDSAEVLSP